MALLTVRVFDNEAENRLWGTPAYQGRIVRRVVIAGECPRCGGARGTPQARRSIDDGDWYTVDVWTNPCGHVDTYANVLREARERAVVNGHG